MAFHAISNFHVSSEDHGPNVQGNSQTWERHCQKDQARENSSWKSDGDSDAPDQGGNSRELKNLKTDEILTNKEEFYLH